LTLIAGEHRQTAIRLLARQPSLLYHQK